MKTKFILWLDSELLTFAIAYYLKKTYDCELYAIIDITNGTKNFFEKQNLVEFEKTWFYFDHVHPQNSEPDYEYLKNIEKKFELNLWNLAINERIFYHYNKFYKFSSNEISSIITQECQLFEKIIDEVKPDFFITKETIQHKDHLFYKMCKQSGVIPLVCYESIIGYKCIISQKEHTIDSITDLPKKDNRYHSFEELQNYFKNFNKSMQVINFRDKYMSSELDRLKAAIKFLLSSNGNNNTKTHYTYFGRSKLRVLISELQSIKKRKSREKFMENNLNRKIFQNEKFIYYPLHIEQERSLLIATPYYTNQIEIILTNSGLNSITIKDDGIGMTKHDLQNSYNSFTTSKIHKADDLYQISTLGFRGEALASIASISQLNIKSKHKSSSSGNEIQLDFGKTK